MGDFGLSDAYEYMEFELDSLDATAAFNGSSAATDWPLFEIAGKGPIKNIAALKILEVQIPFSYYIFNTVNSSFVMTENLDLTPVSTTVTIRPGNYNAHELSVELGRALTAASTISNIYTSIYDNASGKFSFYNNNTVSNVFSFTFGAGYGLVDSNGVPIQPNSGNKNPRLYIGFPPGETRSQFMIAGSGTPSQSNSYGSGMTAPNCDSVSGPNYIYVNSTRIGPDCNVFLPKGAFNLGGGAAGAQIAKIPVTTQAGGILYWTDPDPQKWFDVNGMDSLTTVDFYLTLGNTTSQKPLQLNGLPFSLKLGVLVNTLTSVQSGGGLYSNERVHTRQGPKRIRPAY